MRIALFFGTHEKHGARTAELVWNEAQGHFVGELASSSASQAEIWRRAWVSLV